LVWESFLSARQQSWCRPQAEQVLEQLKVDVNSVYQKGESLSGGR
jgi:hypothetical protein